MEPDDMPRRLSKERPAKDDGLPAVPVAANEAMRDDFLRRRPRLAQELAQRLSRLRALVSRLDGERESVVWLEAQTVGLWPRAGVE